MYSERLQILVSPQQRRRLDEESARSGSSIAALVRDAVDARFGGVSRDDRRRAAERIASRSAEHVAPQELERLVDARYDDDHRELIDGQRR